MSRNTETKNVYSHLQTDRWTFVWLMRPPTPLGTNLQQSPVGPLLKRIHGDAAFSMIGDGETEELLHRSTRMSTVSKTGLSLKHFIQQRIE